MKLFYSSRLFSKPTFSVLFFMLFFQLSIGQTVLGKWKTIDDQTGKAMSIVEIVERNGKIEGRVIDILNPANKNRRCENCEGENKNKPILNLRIIEGLSKKGDEYSGGHILDPKTGKKYKCYITLENKDKLKVRGYIGISLLGRTQYWHRVH
ncbi:DUF2147 domain-containing protein [Flavobacterium sp.]|uniref:DUF2147 domain-containing protein n=1 Tax=Flavobacterium sp. TaxID=239 RepID=UPI003B99277D